MLYKTIIEILLIIFPAYVANSFPVLVGGGPAIDLGATFTDGRRILGSGKTIRGFLGGVSAGIIISGIISLYFPISLFHDGNRQFFSGVMLSLGTMVGDSFGSFIKRRMGIKDGEPFILDQISFLIIGLLFAYPFLPKKIFEIPILISLIIFTYILHSGSNYMANRIGLKRVPW